MALKNVFRFKTYEYFCVIIKIRECFQWIAACSQCSRFLYGHLMSLYHCGTLLVEEPNSSFTVSTKDFIISTTLKILDKVLCHCDETRIYSEKFTLCGYVLLFIELV